ncbi:MAG TPA: oligosaccharide flippase family protein [Pyrinomonadaceae bacterium]|nr:oligosaccharide flippase family protein [Pyrinomonadaceae bacterium]
MPTDSNIHRRQTIVRNSLFGILAWVAPLTVGMVATPILIRNLGNSEFGLYSVVLGFLAYSFGFGVAKVVIKFVAEFRANGLDSRINDVLSAAFWLSLVIGIAGSSVLILAAPFIVSNILLVPAEQVESAILAVYFASAAMIAGQSGQIFLYALQGLHRFGIILFLTTVNGLMLGLGNIVIALNGYGVVALLAWTFFSAAISSLLYVIAAKRALPSLTIHFRFSSNSITSVVKYASSILTYQALANSLYIFERVWVVRTFGPEVMAFYAVPMLLATYMQSFLSSFSATLFPVMNELLNRGEQQIELYKRGSKIIAAFVSYAVVSSVGLGQVALGLWIDPTFARNSSKLLIIHTTSFGLMSILIMSWQLNEAYGAAKLNVILTAIWAIVTIPMMILVADHWGSEGFAFSRLAGIAVTIPMILYFEKRHFGQALIRFWISVILRLGLSGGILMIFYLLVNKFQPSWLGLIGTAVGGLLLYSLTLFPTGFLKRKDLAEALSLLPVPRGLK